MVISLGSILLFLCIFYFLISFDCHSLSHYSAATNEYAATATKVFVDAKEVLNNYTELHGMNRYPFVTIAYAQTLDGSIAGNERIRMNISSDTSFKLLHSLRTIHHGVLIGINTVFDDNPQLNAREVLPQVTIPIEQPRSIILDSKLKILKAKNLKLQRPLVLTTICENSQLFNEASQFLSHYHGSVIHCPVDNCGYCNIDDAFRIIKQQGINSILVEGGGNIIQSVLESSLWNQVMVTIRPSFFGGYRVLSKQFQSEKKICIKSLFNVENEIVVLGLPSLD